MRMENTSSSGEYIREPHLEKQPLFTTSLHVTLAVGEASEESHFIVCSRIFSALPYLEWLQQDEVDHGNSISDLLRMAASKAPRDHCNARQSCIAG